MEYGSRMTAMSNGECRSISMRIPGKNQYYASLHLNT